MTKPVDDRQQKLLLWFQRDRYRLVAFAAFLLILGIVILCLAHVYADRQHLLTTIGSEFGIAMIIAGVLIVGTERYLKERLFSDIEAQFTAKLQSFATTALELRQYGRLPTPLRERLRTRVLSAPVIQRDVTYEYVFEPYGSPDDKVYKAAINSHSTYVNLSTDAQTFDVKEALPILSEENRPGSGFMKVTSQLQGKGAFPKELIPQAIENYISIKAGSRLFQRPAVLEPSAELQVSFSSVAYLDPSDTISLEAFLPTVNMVCTTSGSDLLFRGQAGDALSDMWHVMETESGETRWELKGAILPGQGFDVWFEEPSQGEADLNASQATSGSSEADQTPE